MLFKILDIKATDKKSNEALDRIFKKLSQINFSYSYGKNINLDTQGLSRKIDRGKHTTRVNELYIYEDIMIADTPGFSSLELLDLEYKQLPLFYPEFDEYLDKCRYLDCSHIKEGKDCVIVGAVDKGLINKSRYDRYCNLYAKLKQNWENKYD